MIFKLASQRSVKWLCEVKEETWDWSERQKRGWKVAAVVAVVVDDVAMELELQLQYNCI